MQRFSRKMLLLTQNHSGDASFEFPEPEQGCSRNVLFCICSTDVNDAAAQNNHQHLWNEGDQHLPAPQEAEEELLQVLRGSELRQSP